MFGSTFGGQIEQSQDEGTVEPLLGSTVTKSNCMDRIITLLDRVGRSIIVSKWEVELMMKAPNCFFFSKKVKIELFGIHISLLNKSDEQ
jgi:hypothetical protein